MARVIVVGSLNIDSVVEVQRHPGPGETVHGGDLRTLWGGKGANQAVAAASAGAETAMIGRVGDDPAGHRYIERLSEMGIDVRGVVFDPARTTGHAAIAVDESGENTIIVSPGANGAVTMADLAALDDVGPDDIVVLQLEIAHDVVIEAARRASQRGARVVLTLAPYADLPLDVLNLADPVVVNEHEAAQLDAAGLTPRSLLVTLGAEGSRWGDVRASAQRVDDVVDTTGAGDSYCGTLAARLAAGDPAVTAMEAASRAAALTVGRAGAQPS